MPLTSAFGERLRAAFDDDSAPIRVPRNSNVYMQGDRSACVYLVETGRIKLLTLSPSGKECLLAIHPAGDIFGELSLGNTGHPWPETAVAMSSSVVRSMRGPEFLAALSRKGLVEDFVEHLTRRIARQAQIITSLVTVDSEQRLAETLLFLADTLGEPASESRRIAPGLSHEELAQIIGTTRPRVTEFMSRFRASGLVRTTGERHLIVNSVKLAAHLAQIHAAAAEPAGPRTPYGKRKWWYPREPRLATVLSAAPTTDDAVLVSAK